MTQIDAEKELAEICGISGRKKQELFPAENVDNRRKCISGDLRNLVEKKTRTVSRRERR